MNADIGHKDLFDEVFICVHLRLSAVALPFYRTAS
jgi:hypothetical protein